jgi:hypothetical protein
MRIVTKGMPLLQKRLAAVKDAGPLAAQQVLLETAHQVLAVSQQDYVPVDTGALKNSGVVETDDLGTRFVVTVGYGGPAAEYALHVHEDLVARHVVGQAKYLEVPFRAAVEGMWGVLRTRVRDAVRTSEQAVRYARLRTPEALARFYARRAGR